MGQDETHWRAWKLARRRVRYSSLTYVCHLIPLFLPFHPCRAQSLPVLSFACILSRIPRQTRVASKL